MCAYDEPASVCESANSGIVIFKDCNTTCTGFDGCNDGNDVELLFSAMDESGNPKEMSCYAYRSDNRDDNQPGIQINILLGNILKQYIDIASINNGFHSAAISLLNYLKWL